MIAKTETSPLSKCTFLASRHAGTAIGAQHRDPLDRVMQPNAPGRRALGFPRPQTHTTEAYVRVRRPPRADWHLSGSPPGPARHTRPPGQPRRHLARRALPADGPQRARRDASGFGPALSRGPPAQTSSSGTHFPSRSTYPASRSNASACNRRQDSAAAWSGKRRVRRSLASLGMAAPSARYREVGRTGPTPCTGLHPRHAKPRQWASRCGDHTPSAERVIGSPANPRCRAPGVGAPPVSLPVRRRVASDSSAIARTAQHSDTFGVGDIRAAEADGHGVVGREVLGRAAPPPERRATQPAPYVRRQPHQTGRRLMGV